MTKLHMKVNKENGHLDQQSTTHGKGYSEIIITDYWTCCGMYCFSWFFFCICTRPLYFFQYSLSFDVIILPVIGRMTVWMYHWLVHLARDNVVYQSSWLSTWYRSKSQHSLCVGQMGLSDKWAVVQVGFMVSDKWDAHHWNRQSPKNTSHCRTNGLSDNWAVGQVGCRTSGLYPMYTLPISLSKYDWYVF